MNKYWGVFKEHLKNIYRKLAGINDTPHRKAAGLGLGVFLGIFPGMGPIAALALSWLLRVNRAAALLGSLLTNTWISVVTFVFAVKIGAALTGTNWEEVFDATKDVFKDFHFNNLLDVSFLNILKPLLIGYVVVGVFFGVMAYGISLFFLRRFARKADNRLA